MNMRTALFTLALWLAGLGVAAAQANNSIDAFDVSEQGGNVIVRITTKSPLASVPPNFSVANPARIAFDFPGTVNALGRSNQDIGLVGEPVLRRQRADVPRPVPRHDHPQDLAVELLAFGIAAHHLVDVREIDAAHQGQRVIRLDGLLAVRNPTPVKRLFGALLILVPGTLILLTVYFVEITGAVGWQPPHVAAQQKRLERMQTAKAKKPATSSRKSVSRGSNHSPRALAKGKKKTSKQRSPIEAKRSRGKETKSRVEPKQKRESTQTVSAKRTPQKQTRRKVDPQSWVTKGNQLAAVSLGDLDTAIRYLAEDYDEGFRILESSHRVVILKENLRVYITEYDYVDGRVKIRLQGTTEEWWTFKEALKKG